jgi:hypothetical protein
VDKRDLNRAALLVLFKIVAAGLAFAVLIPCAGAESSHCDSSCLTSAMNDYLSKMLAHQTGAIRLAPNAMVYVNSHPIGLNEVPMGRAKEIKSKQIFSDPVSGNVVARTGLEMDDGKIAYASTRLKIIGGTITQIEMSFDDSQRVVPSYVTFLDPVMTTVVPPEKRMSRDELKAIIERYFQGLTDHQPVAADYDDRCDRYHSGQRVTNNQRNSVEGPGPKNCFEANNGLGHGDQQRTSAFLLSTLSTG